MEEVRVVTVDDASILVFEKAAQETKGTWNARLGEYCFRFGRISPKAIAF